MRHPLRSLRPFLWLSLALLIWFQVPTFILLALFRVPVPEGLIVGHLAITTLLVAFYAWLYRWLWRFCRRVRRFATAENARIALHYEPELVGMASISALLQFCEKELDNLTQWFGSPLRGRVNVFLFARWRDISAIYGSGYGGLAISRANLIVIAWDNNVPESVRHELAHLFAFRWSVQAPPLLSEGLPVWLQGSHWGRSIDDEARTLIQRPCPRLTKLLRKKFFFAEAQRQACYLLAGSFTGFLIRRYGWDSLRELYRCCDGTRFAAKFEKCFGISLDKADWQWRNEVMVMPILNRRLGRKPRC